MPLSSRKRILLLCPYPEGVAPGQRLKYEQYLDFLRAQGFEIEISPFLSLDTWKILYQPGQFLAKAKGVIGGYLRRIRDLARVGNFDGVYVFLNITPFGGSLFERLFRIRASRLVYDIDDLVYLGRASEANRITQFLKRPEKYKFLMEKADHVITCTPYLDAYVRQLNSRTTDISSTIQTDVYLPVNRYRNDKTLVLGWSGSHSTVPYLRLLGPVLREFAKRRKFLLRVIGSPEFELDGVTVDALPWVKSSEVENLQAIDIGLYPLPNEEWVYGKSGLKALQYMSLGIPTVATAIGTNFRIMEHGVSGYLAHSEEEWLRYLDLLYCDPQLRERIGRRARERVEAQFSVAVNQSTYLGVFREVFLK